MSTGFSFMFNVFPILFGIVFVIIVGFIIFSAVKGVSRWSKNNNSPVLSVSATVVAKRTAVDSHHHHNADNMAMSSTTYSTTYFVTFEVESGDRMELLVPDPEYGMLVEGDAGKLTFQGTRYKAFERMRTM